jgi:hypothetical protein
MGLKKKVIISQSLDDWAYLLWVDKAEKVHPREKPLLLLLPALDKSLVALDGEEAPLVEVGGGPPPWVDTDQDFFCKLDMKPHTYASSGSKHFSLYQTYQNYQQRRKKLTHIQIKLLKKSKLSKKKILLV